MIADDCPACRSLGYTPGQEIDDETGLPTPPPWATRQAKVRWWLARIAIILALIGAAILACAGLGWPSLDFS